MLGGLNPLGRRLPRHRRLYLHFVHNSPIRWVCHFLATHPCPSFARHASPIARMCVRGKVAGAHEFLLAVSWRSCQEPLQSGAFKTNRGLYPNLAKPLFATSYAKLWIPQSGDSSAGENAARSRRTLRPNDGAFAIFRRFPIRRCFVCVAVGVLVTLCSAVARVCLGKGCLPQNLEQSRCRLVDTHHFPRRGSPLSS